MIFDLIIYKGIDGFSAEVPSLNGCEAWAHSEDEVLDKITDMVVYFLGLKNRKMVKLDLARREDDNKIYKIIVPNRN